MQPFSQTIHKFIASHRTAECGPGVALATLGAQESREGITLLSLCLASLSLLPASSVHSSDLPQEEQWPLDHLELVTKYLYPF